MNSNGQILDDVNRKLDHIRRLKTGIEKRKIAITALEGRTQSQIKLCVGDEYIDLGAISYARGAVKARKPFNTAIVFIKRGLNEEIEQFYSAIEKLKSELNEMKLGDWV